MKNELYDQVKSASGEEFLPTAAAAINFALLHLRDFCRTNDVWDRDDVKDVCYDIGELVYCKEDMDGLKTIYYLIRSEMGPIAARYLEHFWNGVGDGAWRG